MTRLIRLMTIGFACTLALVSTASASDEYEYAIFEIVAPDDYSNVGWAVNDLGVTVGSSIITELGSLRGFVSDGKYVIELSTFGGLDSKAWGVNEAGNVVGWADTPANKPHAFLWTLQAGLADLGTFGGSSSKAFAVSDAGEVVGSANFEGDLTAHAFLWDGAGLIDLGSLDDSRISFANDINELGIIVGESNNSSGTSRPVMWQNNEIIDLGSLGDGSHPGSARAINDLNQIVGQSDDDNHDNFPFLWADGEMYKLGYRSGHARDINNDTQVVGIIARGRQGNNGAFLWELATSMRYLDDLIPPRTEIYLNSGHAISDTGLIVADGPDPDSCGPCLRTFMLVPVSAELTLSDPLPGVVGQTNTWTITGAQPNAKIHFAYSLKGGGTVVPGCDKLDAVVQLNKPKVVKTVTADANGNATIDLYVPPAASGAGLILFQAVDQQNCEESQLTTFDFE